MPWLSGPNLVPSTADGAAFTHLLGPFQNGSNLFAVAVPGAGGYDLWKSTDGGDTFALVGSHNTGTISDVPVSYVPATGLLYVLVTRASGGSHLEIDIWDLATDTLTSTVNAAATFPTVNSAGVGGRADGSFLLLVNPGGGGARIKVSLCTGGVFGAVQTVNSSVVTSPFFIDSDAASTSALYYFQNTGTLTFRMRPIDAAGVLGTETTIASGLAVSSAGVYGPYAVQTATEFWISLRQAGVFRSQSLVAPVWVNAALPVVTNMQTANVNLVTDGVDVWAVYPVQNSFVSPRNPDQLWISKYLGVNTWGAPILLVDFIAHPPNYSPTPANQFAHFYSSARLANGSIGTLCDFLIDPGAICTMFYTHTVDAEPLVLVGNPPSGDVGIPYSFQFSATGGVPGYTFTGLNLPPGLTLSPDGLLSGVPTEAGDFSAVTIDVQDFVGTITEGVFDILIVAAVHIRVTLLGVKRYPAEFPRVKVEAEKPAPERSIESPPVGFPGGGVPL